VVTSTRDGGFSTLRTSKGANQLEVPSAWGRRRLPGRFFPDGFSRSSDCNLFFPNDLCAWRARRNALAEALHKWGSLGTETQAWESCHPIAAMPESRPAEARPPRHLARPINIWPKPGRDAILNRQFVVVIPTCFASAPRAPHGFFSMSDPRRYSGSAVLPAAPEPTNCQI
jgi:hypothetical protein